MTKQNIPVCVNKGLSTFSAIWNIFQNKKGGVVSGALLEKKKT